MITPQCQAACNAGIAVNAHTRTMIHAGCPGVGRIDGVSAIGWCTCECHGEQFGEPGIGAADGRPIPYLLPDDTTKTPPLVVGRGASVTGDNTCECGCGGTTGARFVPGHDAKLKSRLYAEAFNGDALSWTEILVRNWGETVSAVKKDRLHVRVKRHGEDLAGELVAAGTVQGFLNQRINNRREQVNA